MSYFVLNMSHPPTHGLRNRLWWLLKSSLWSQRSAEKIFSYTTIRWIRILKTHNIKRKCNILDITNWPIFLMTLSWLFSSFSFRLLSNARCSEHICRRFCIFIFILIVFLYLPSPKYNMTWAMNLNYHFKWTAKSSYKLTTIQADIRWPKHYFV